VPACASEPGPWLAVPVVPPGTETPCSPVSRCGCLSGGISSRRGRGGGPGASKVAMVEGIGSRGVFGCWAVLCGDESGEKACIVWRVRGLCA